MYGGDYAGDEETFQRNRAPTRVRRGFSPSLLPDAAEQDARAGTAETAKTEWVAALQTGAARRRGGKQTVTA